MADQVNKPKVIAMSVRMEPSLWKRFRVRVNKDQVAFRGPSANEVILALIRKWLEE